MTRKRTEAIHRGEARMRRTERLFTALVVVLLLFGVVMVHSAEGSSRPWQDGSRRLERHALYVLIALVAYSICARLEPGVWFRMAPGLFVVAVGLLVIVLLPGVGAEINGARRWIRVGRLSFQPTELAKIALPLLLCRLAVSRRHIQLGWLRRLGLLAVVGLAVLLPTLAEPDFGTAAFLTLGAAIALFVAGWPLRDFVVAAALVPPAFLAVLWHRPYQWQRLTGFLNTWTNPEQAPYQIRQSLLSMGTGGWTGVGLGQGVQKLSFLPEKTTDFVVAVVGEELGLLGTLGLSALWMGLFACGWCLLRRLDRRSFAFAAALTLLVQVVLQAGLNVAVVTALVPPKGIPHPFLSYGGSNLLATMVSLGIVVGLSRADRCEASAGDPVVGPLDDPRQPYGRQVPSRAA